MKSDEDARQRLHAALKQVAYDELELRVGTQLSSGLSDRQLEEFEAIIDRDKERLASWLYSNSPDFESDPEFQRLESAMPEASDPLDLVAEFAAVKWLQLHCPDYRKVTHGVMSVLVNDIISWADDTIGWLEKSNVRSTLGEESPQNRGPELS